MKFFPAILAFLLAFNVSKGAASYRVLNARTGATLASCKASPALVCCPLLTPVCMVSVNAAGQIGPHSVIVAAK